MADDEKIRTPDELGEAVGRKIDKLFTSVFDNVPSPEVEGGPVSLEGEETAGPSAPRQRPAAPPTPTGKPKRGDPMDQLLDRIEVLVLGLDWDIRVETIRELAVRFQELDRLITQEGPARTVVNVNRRILSRFSTPGVSPPPMMVKLLQESTTALRRMKSSQGSAAGDRDLVAGIINTYNQIVAALRASAEPAKVEPSKEAPQFTTLLGHVGGAVHSLEEVGQRLARIVSVLRKGGEMSDEELTRRLGTLEGLLAERVGRLSTLQKELSRLGPLEAARGRAGSEGKTPEGILLVQWSGIPLAIPSSVISALYPLTKAQAQDYVGKNALPLFGRNVPRYPLKGPSKAAPAPIPSWLIYLSLGAKEFFLLADKALGYRRAPAGLDLARQNRIKVGEASYPILNLAAFR